MRFSLCAALLYAAFAAALPSQNWVEKRDDLAPIDQDTGVDAPVDAAAIKERGVKARQDTSPPPIDQITDVDAPVVESTNVTERDLETRQYQTLTWVHNPWKFSVAVTGNHLIKMWSSGSVQFYTRFRATGFWSYDYAIACAVRDVGGRVYTLSRKGRVKGTIEPGSRTHEVDKTIHSPDVKKWWNDIMKGDRRMHCRVTLKNSISWDNLKKLVNDIVGVIKGVAAVAGVIALF